MIISILVGAFSHLLWDSFTHHDGYFVNKIFLLQNSIEILNTKVPILKLLQHSSTLIGALVIAFTIYQMPIKSVVNQKVSLKYWFILIIITFIIIILRLLNGLDIKQFGDLIVTTISATLISLILTSITFNNKNGI